MNETDRAFVAAYQQSLIGGQQNQQDGLALPPRPKAPLSSYRADQQEAPAGGQHGPGVELASFAWPEVADSLASAGEQQLLCLLQVLVDGGPQPAPIAFCSAAPRAGLTTMILALARTASRAGISVAMIDSTGGAEGLAGSLGVNRTSPIEVATSDAVDASLIASRRDRCSLLSLAGSSSSLIPLVLAHLAKSHELVLIDAGAAAHAAPWVGQAATVLVDRVNGVGGPQRFDAARLVFGGDPIAVIETFAPVE